LKIAHTSVQLECLFNKAGGGGVEYYFGYSYSDNDLSCQNLASRQNMWTQSRYALEFFRNNDVPFHRMSNVPNRVKNATDWLLSSSDMTVHVIYRRSTPSSGKINMTGLPGTYSVNWYNPRMGGLLQNGSVTSIVGGGGSVSFGSPPNPADTKDWALLLRRS
jgi:Putative collagen-binding domain of a collagenase